MHITCDIYNISYNNNSAGTRSGRSGIARAVGMGTVHFFWDLGARAET